MVRIIVITHTYDNFCSKNSLLASVGQHWVDAGHEVSVVAGLGNWPEGDVAVMHVDFSVVPAAYAEAAKRYPIVVNGAALDIRKRRVSRNLVAQNDGWDGPVVVKTDLNYHGIPEMHAAQMARHDGRPAEMPSGSMVAMNRSYPIFRSPSEVPDEIWNNPGLVIERFLPERDAQGYWLRVWVFCGDHELCSRCRGTHPIVKSENIVAYEMVSVPDEMRVERERLGFDYGKFDFVVHQGKPILLDANRTPSVPGDDFETDEIAARLAGGLESLMRKQQ